MSPEQAEGREVGPPSDIFGLGAVLAFAATGAGPFGGGSTPALVYRVVHSPASLDHVPAEVRPLIERCLAKDPGQRPAARDLLAEAAAVQPGPGWLPEPATRTSLQLPARAGLPETVTSLALAPAQAAARPRREKRPRRVLSRPLAIASMVAGLLAATAGGGMALTASAHLSTPHAGRTAHAHGTRHDIRHPVTPTPTVSQRPSRHRPRRPETTAPTATPTPTATATPTHRDADRDRDADHHPDGGDHDTGSCRNPDGGDHDTDSRGNPDGGGPARRGRDHGPVARLRFSA